MPRKAILAIILGLITMVVGKNQSFGFEIGDQIEAINKIKLTWNKRPYRVLPKGSKYTVTNIRDDDFRFIRGTGKAHFEIEVERTNWIRHLKKFKKITILARNAQKFRKCTGQSTDSFGEAKDKFKKVTQAHGEMEKTDSIEISQQKRAELPAAVEEEERGCEEGHIMKIGCLGLFMVGIAALLLSLVTG